jgi:hypothetical protein
MPWRIGWIGGNSDGGVTGMAALLKVEQGL